MGFTDLPTSLRGYALEATCEIKLPLNLSLQCHLRYGEGVHQALSINKLEARTDKCTFIGFSKETKGNYLYHLYDHKVFVATGGTFFLEREFLTEEIHVKEIELDEDQPVN